ncbi:hypothetical protein [Labrys monachus]|uniref:Ferredoxin n=1 Tax=Labrys monachus TaxID=217067 RepID=A0ABU0FIT6_9HYPH|nr:hypothetical protein [Labrys monachus]MDQ0394505.1 ferredoxin [Labrys monachus]
MSIADELDAAAQAAGLSLRGIFHPVAADGVPDAAVQTLVMLGWIGGAQWHAFAASPEAGDGQPHPLDRWSRRVIDALAEAFGAVSFYPFGGPPYLPFQRWAQRGDNVYPSPLGIFIHPVHGLWHSYRGALGFPARLDLPPRGTGASPCQTCEGRPCLSACPVGAFTTGGYDVDRCAAHVKSDAGEPCRMGGCLARRACPVGAERRYGTDGASFYMAAFVAAR